MSISDYGRNNLGVVGSGLDHLFVTGDDTRNLFAPKQKWFKAQHHVKYHEDVPAQNRNYSYGGSEVVFEIQKEVDLIRGLQLIVERGQLTGGANPSFNDFEGFSSIEHFIVEYGNNRVINLTGDQMYKNLMEKPFPEVQKEARFQNGWLTKTEREELAADTSHTWICNLLASATEIGKYDTPIFLHSLPNKLRVKIKFRPLKECTRATNPTCSIRNVSLRVIGIAQFLYQQNLNNELVFGPGIDYKVTSLEHHTNEKLEAGKKYHILDLHNFVNTFYAWRITIQKTSTLETNETLDRFKYVLPKSISVMNNQSLILPKIELSENKAYFRKQILSDIFGGEVSVLDKTNIIYIPFIEEALVKDSDNNAFGGRNPHLYNKLRLRIDWDDDLPEEYTCTVESLVHDLIVQEKGDIRSVLKIN